jgi:hypothetical protein
LAVVQVLLWVSVGGVLIVDPGLEPALAATTSLSPEVTEEVNGIPKLPLEVDVMQLLWTKVTPAIVVVVVLVVEVVVDVVEVEVVEVEDVEVDVL